MKGGLVDDGTIGALVTVPAQLIDGFCRTAHLDHHANSIERAYRIVRRIWRQKHHASLGYDNVTENAVVYYSQDHRAAVLIEPLRGVINMVVCPRVRSADNLSYC